MKYIIYQAPGWHSEPTDPVIERTHDEREAAMRAGERVDIHMPGGSNPHDAYALDDAGNEVEPIESYRCDACGELHEWGESGPYGAIDGKILECPEAQESHLVTWLCEDCAMDYCWGASCGGSEHCDH